MLPDRVSNPGPLTYESGVLPIALRGPADIMWSIPITSYQSNYKYNAPRSVFILFFIFEGQGEGCERAGTSLCDLYFSTILVSADFCFR